jgi:pimeloyl-ACP methyl ester carboxylesterase
MEQGTMPSSAAVTTPARETVNAPTGPQAVTAGFLNTDWSPRDVPHGTVTRNVVLRTADNAAVTGSLYCRGKPDTVVCVMHPREFMACHYLVPDIVESGCAAWSQGSRSVGNDLRLEHELALFDVAAGLNFLRDQGFKKIVLLGNSGGASLYAFYVQQSSLDGSRRLARTPGGRPTRLDTLTMPEVDGFVFVAPHPGQGVLLMGCIDPSITDERDPLSVDASLDPLDPKNGFAEPPASSKYTAEFLQRYQAAQRARVARLDAVAKDLIAARMDARKQTKDGGGDEHLRRIAAHTPIMTIWRTDADPRCFDLSLDPSDRGYGTLWGRDPRISNYGAVGFARNCTPEAWLSTWSGLSSHAALAKTVPSITQPTMFVEYTGDVSTFPSVARELFGMIRTSQKTHLRVRGDHHGRALSKGEELGRNIAGAQIRDWLREQFA